MVRETRDGRTPAGATGRSLPLLAGFAVTALLLMGLVARGTVAYLSDTETSTGNEFAAGTLDLAVDGHNPWSATVDANLQALVPEEVGTVDLSLTNVGSLPFDIWLIVESVSTAAGEETAPEIADPRSPANDIDGVTRFKLDIDGAPEILYTANFTISNGSHHLVGLTYAMKNQYVYLGTIPFQGDMDVTLYFRLDNDPANTINWAQGDTMTFKVRFYAQQTGASAPTPELSGHGRT